MASEPNIAQSLDLARALKYGVGGGIIAGITFAIAEMVLAALTDTGPLAPLQMIGAILLGPAVLPQAGPTAGIIVSAFIVHFVLSAIYGVILAGVAPVLPFIQPSAAQMTVLGMLFGLLLWAGNYYLIAPAAFPWFTHTQPLVQMTAHILFFGAVLGYYLGTQLSQHAEPAQP
ncbi:MAG: hypothetical protein ACYC1C_04930 [Chloroflexota bacterium]